MRLSLKMLAMCGLLLIATGLADRSAVAGERLALVIGNAGYESETLSPLKNPTNDAALIADALAKAGFKVETVMDADLRAMKRAIQGFGKRLGAAGPDAIGTFYYSGHGFQANGLNYLAPLKADLRDEVDAEFEAMSVDWVLGKLEKAHKGANVVILDACRNTALSRGMRGAGEGLALLRATPRGSFISFATAPGSTAADGNTLNSPYTSAIAREMLKPGQTIETVFKNVRRSVVAETGGKQVPWDHSSLTADVVFVEGDGAAEEAAVAALSKTQPNQNAMQIELQLWNDVKNSGSAEQLQFYLDKFPSGAFAGLAKSRLASLTKSDADVSVTPQMEKLFAQLASRSLIVENPKAPYEFYSNARLHEIQGNFIKARQDYLKFFAFGLDFVDPHYRFQNFLKAQEGRAGARETYFSLTAGRRDPVLNFVTVLLNDREQRIEQLRTVIEQNPDFAPAYYELSRDYSLARLGRQSTADKREELALLTRFMELVEDGRFLRYFIDQQMAADQVEEAKTRLAALSYLSSKVLKNPVSMTSSRSNQGWTLTLSIADQVQEIFIATGDGDFKSTGFVQGVLHPSTGKPLPYPSTELPGNAKATVLKVKYVDIRGQTQGPFDIRFDPNSALVAGQKSILERLSNGWVSYRDWNGKTLIYFTHLISYRCAIDKVEYGFNRDTPNREYKLAKCNPKDPHSVKTRSGKDTDIYKAIPRGTRYTTIRLTYKDGTQSDVKRFDVQ